MLALLLAAAILLLQSCGGGGGDSGGGGNSDAYSVSPTSISFTATQGGATPAAKTSTLQVLKGTVFVGTSQTGSGFSHTFQITGPTTGVITITPDAPTTPGTFTGAITVFGCSNQVGPCAHVAGSPKTINVTYTVTAAPTLTSTPPTIEFVTTTGNLPGSKTITLALSSGSLPWTAGAPNYAGTSGWLNVTPTSGTLNPSQVVTFDVTDASTAEVRTATVTFTAGALTKVVPVSLVINDPRANFVSPYVVPAGSGGNVIIRGYGFSTLIPGSEQVLFGATPATAVSVISDTEIHATYPSLAASSYAITVTDGTNTLASRAALKLLVVNPPGFASATVTRTGSPGGVGNLIYDAERQALYVMDGDNNRVERYSFAAATWSLNGTNIAGGGGNNPRIAFSPDGTEILKTAGGQIVRISPVTLATLSTPAASIAGSSLQGNMIAFANDGGAIGNCTSPPALGVTLYRYDMLTQQFTGLSTQSDLVNRAIVASGDGDTLVLPTFEPLAPGFEKPVVVYDASGTGTLSQAALVTSGTGTEHASVSRDGSRVILVNFPLSGAQTTTVYSKSGAVFTALGTLPAGLTGVVISPDGAFAYAYFSGTTSVRKFDLNSPDGSGGFTQTGSVNITSPGTFFNSMAISPDGGSLFLAGNQLVVIAPAP
ncbi:MAG TPA: BACON domain-containing carbohydrate-binding protein [Burkholderiales bacterium]|nr:BACON domain-containing carbohydrate-binding protein [Burkholderiales bacterium]